MSGFIIMLHSFSVIIWVNKVDWFQFRFISHKCCFEGTWVWCVNSIVKAFSSWYMCWEKSIKGKSINGLTMHADRAHYGVCRKNCFISYVRISHVNSSVSVDTYVWTLKMFPGYYRSNVGTFKALLTCHPVYRDTLWHDRTKLSNIPRWEIIHS